MRQIVETTDKEKYEMYNLLEKNELIKMLIEANRHLYKVTPIITIGDTCSCNPINGGDGICRCTVGNQIIDNNEYTYHNNIIISAKKE